MNTDELQAKRQEVIAATNTFLGIADSPEAREMLTWVFKGSGDKSTRLRLNGALNSLARLSCELQKSQSIK